MSFKNRSKFTVAIFLACSLLISLFQNCGSSTPNNYSVEDDDGGNGKLDTDGPKISLVEKPALLTNSAKATFQLVASDDRSGVDKIEFQLDDNAWKTVNNMVVEDGLASGAHEAKFKATDKKGNASMVLSYKWTVDVNKPVVAFTGNIPNEMSHLAQFEPSKRMRIEFTATDDKSISSMECKIDGDEIPCSPVSGKAATYAFSAPVSVAFHTARIEVMDSAGNKTTKAHNWIVTDKAGEILAPVMAKTPNTYNNLSSVKIRFNGIPASSTNVYSCTLDNKAITPCTPNTDIIYDGITVLKNSSGKVMAHKFKVTLKYGSSGSKSSEAVWYTDTEAPKNLKIGKTVPAMVLTSAVQMKYDVTDDSDTPMLKCKLDGEVFEPCNPNVQFEVSATPGNHTFTVDAHDAAGNFIDVSKRLEVSWRSASCNAGDISLRWPMKGPENSNWGVYSFYDTDRASGTAKRDWGPRDDERARTYDNAAGIYLTPGLNTNTYFINGNVITGSRDSASVLAMDSGTVKRVVQGYADTSVSGIPSGCNSSQFNFVEIQHDNGFITVYRHLAKNSVPANVAVGKRVTKGTLIGYVGSSGCLLRPQLNVFLRSCTGDFVHLNPTNMGVDEKAMVYDGKPMIFKLTAHNGKRDTSNAATLKAVLNGAFMNANEAGKKANKNAGITVTYFAGRLTHGQHLRMLLIPPDVSSIADLTKIDHRIYMVNNSFGRDVTTHHDVKKVGTWKMRIYHMGSDDCRSMNPSKWSSCLLEEKLIYVEN